MKDRDAKKILKRICNIQGTEVFEVSAKFEATTSKYFLIVKTDKLELSQLGLSIHNIEKLEENKKITLLKKWMFEDLDENETFRNQYSIKSDPNKFVYYSISKKGKWSPLPIITILGGIIVSIISIIMVANRVNIVGYDSGFMNGYWYTVLSPKAMLFFGLFLLTIGLLIMPKTKKP